MTPRARNKVTGEIYEPVNGEWVPVAPGKLLAEETGPVEAGFIGAGKALTDVYEGVKGAVGYGRSPADAAEAERLYAPLREASPVATAIGESAPYAGAALGAGVATGGMGLLPALLAQAGASGAVGLAMPGTAGERLTRGVTDAALGAAGEGLGRFLAPVARSFGRDLPAATAERLAGAKAAGYNLPPQTYLGATGPGRFVQGALDKLPDTSEILRAPARRNQELFDSHVARALGSQEPVPTQAVIDAAGSDVEGTLAGILRKGAKFEVGEAEQDAFERVAASGIRMYLPASGSGPLVDVRNVVVKTRDALLNGTIDGSALNSLQARLAADGMAQLAPGGNPVLGQSLLDVRGLLLDVAAKKLPERDARLVVGARDKARLLHALEAGAWDSKTGSVSAPRVAEFLARRDPQGFVQGSVTSGPIGDVYNGAAFMGRMQPKALPSPATDAGSWLGGEKRGIGGALLGGALQGTFGSGATGALVATAAPWLVAKTAASAPMRALLTRQPHRLEALATQVAGQVGAMATREAAGEPPAVKAAAVRAPVLRDAAAFYQSLGSRTEAEKLGYLAGEVAKGDKPALQEAVDTLRRARDAAARKGQAGLLDQTNQLLRRLGYE